jgi:intracellular sulfur oxidation DsrE/DsrF family protein
MGSLQWPEKAHETSRLHHDGRSLASGNTMKSQNGTLKDLLPSFVGADQGGVVRLAELQAQGYFYLRP